MRLASSALILPHLLNVFWMWLMLKGLFALAGGSGKKKQKQERKGDSSTAAQGSAATTKAAIGESGEERAEHLKAA